MRKEERDSYERERIALKEDRRKARRLRESGKSVAVGGGSGKAMERGWQRDREGEGIGQRQKTEGSFAELSYAAPLAMSVTLHG